MLPIALGPLPDALLLWRLPAAAASTTGAAAPRLHIAAAAATAAVAAGLSTPSAAAVRKLLLLFLCLVTPVLDGESVIAARQLQWRAPAIRSSTPSRWRRRAMVRRWRPVAPRAIAHLLSCRPAAATAISGLGAGLQWRLPTPGAVVVMVVVAAAAACAGIGAPVPTHWRVRARLPCVSFALIPPRPQLTTACGRGLLVRLLPAAALLLSAMEAGGLCAARITRAVATTAPAILRITAPAAAAPASTPTATARAVCSCTGTAGAVICTLLTAPVAPRLMIGRPAAPIGAIRPPATERPPVILG